MNHCAYVRVTQVKCMLMNSTFVDSTPVFYARGKQFQVLRLVFIAYLLLPSIFLLIQASSLTWQVHHLGIHTPRWALFTYIVPVLFFVFLID